jgi:hypothetical protein
MLDYGNAPFLWLADNPDMRGMGGNLCDGVGWDESFPMSEDLWRKFADWAISFDKTRFDWSGYAEGWDWAEFHNRGLQLAQWLKNEVGDSYRVVYEKPWEDVASRNELGVEVQLARASTISRGRKHPAYRPKNLLTKAEVESLLNDAKEAHIKSRKILGYD